MTHPHTSSNPIVARSVQLINAIDAFKQGAPDLHRRLREALAKRSDFRVEFEPFEPVLVQALWTEPDPEIRIRVAETLGRFMTGDSPEATNALRQATKDENPEVRKVAKRILVVRHLAGMAQLLEFMRDEDPKLRRQATHALREMDIDLASEAVSVLIETLRTDKDKDVRLETLATLTWMCQEAEEAIFAILEVLQSEPDDSVREAATRALLVIDPEHRTTLRHLKVLQGDTTREVLLRGLRKMGQEARSLRRALQATWAETQKPDLPHPDGPELPDKFWFRGTFYDIPPIPCKLLTCLWGKDQVTIKDVALEVWRKAEPSPDQVKSALKKINDVLQEAKVGLSYGRKQEYILQQ